MRRPQIASAVILRSATAAVLTDVILGLPPDSWQGFEAVVPGLFGLEPITIAAHVLTIGVSTGVTLAAFLETALQVSDVHRRRLDLRDRRSSKRIDVHR